MQSKTQTLRKKLLSENQTSQSFFISQVKISNISQKQVSTKLEKYIDQSLEDYEITKNQIHQQFLKRHNKQKIINRNQRLSHTAENNQKTQKTKNHRKTSQRSIFSQKFKNKLLNETDFSKRKYDGVKDQETMKITQFKQNLFDHIIRQAQQQEEDDQYINLFRSRKLKSQSNIDGYQSKQKRKTNLKSISSQKTLPNNSKLSESKELKSILSLPKITRLSQSQFQNQSILKTLDYLHQAIGKQEIPKIKKILQIDNPQKKKLNSLQNKYLKQYFNQQQKIETQHQILEEKKECLNHANKKCKKFKQQNYQKFMKFS